MSISFNFMMLTFFLIYTKNIAADLLQAFLVNTDKTPIALIRTNNEDLSFASPHEYRQNEKYISFIYNENNQRFTLACPPRMNSEVELQKQWNIKKPMYYGSVEDVLFFHNEYTKVDMVCTKEIVPTVKRIYDPKGSRNHELYEVGYPVWNENKLMAEFVSSYQVHLNKERNKSYTIHKIQFFNFLKFKDFYHVDVLFSTYFDTYNNSPGKWWEEAGIEIFQLVDYYDMVPYSRQITTLFPFNFVSVKSHHTKKHLITINNYIRLFAKIHEIELTIYSGKYTRQFTELKTNFRFFKREVSVIIEYLWKVIHDSQNRAIVVITQLPPFDDCSVFCAYNVITIDQFEYGCTFTCQFDKNMPEKFGFVFDFKPAGSLDFSLPSMREQNNVLSQGNGENNPKRKCVSISNFLNFENGFENAMSAYKEGKMENVSDENITYDKTCGMDFETESMHFS